MSTALTLLESSRAATAQVFGQIAQTMNSVVENRKQVADFELGVAKTQFAVAEQVRMHDAQIAEINFGNSLAAAKHNAEMQLMPMKVENERLRLEQQKILTKRAISDDNSGQFDKITAGYDDILGAEFARNQDPTFAQKSLELKAKWKARVASGQPYDDAAYKAEVDGLLSGYAMKEAKKGYDPEVHQYLGIMGAKSAEARYAQQNPAIEKNIMGVKAGILLGPAETFGKQLEGTNFTPEETENLAKSKRAFDAKDQEAKMLMAEAQMLREGLDLMDSASPEYAAQQAAIASKINQVKETIKSKEDIFHSGITGKAQDQIPPEVKENENFFKSMQEAIERNKQANEKLPSPLLPGEEGEARVEAVRTKQQELQRQFPEALSGISLKPIASADIKNNPEVIQNLRRQISRNIDGSDVDVKQVFESKAGREKLSRIFKNLQESSVTIYDAYGDNYNRKGVDVNVTRVGGKNDLSNTWGMDDRLSNSYTGGTSQMDNMEQLMKVINAFDGSETEKELFLHDIYVNLVTADLVNSFR